MKRILALALMIYGFGLWIFIGGLTITKTASSVNASLNQIQNQPATGKFGFNDIIAAIPTIAPTASPTLIPSAAPTAKKTSTKKTTTTAPTTGAGLPKTLKIPKIGINAAVEYVGQDAAGRMDVPKQWYTAGWYRLGYKPGDNGAAVFSGHLDTSSGAPAVFWNLGKLNAGDDLYVVNDTGKNLHFKVYEKTTYPWDEIPLARIFGTGGLAGVNLITCGGTWDRAGHNYSQRTVIYSKLVSS